MAGMPIIDRCRTGQFVVAEKGIAANPSLGFRLGECSFFIKDDFEKYGFWRLFPTLTVYRDLRGAQDEAAKLGGGVVYEVVLKRVR